MLEIVSITSPLNKVPAKRANRLTIVLSQGQSRNPEKRGLEDAISAGTSAMTGLQTIVIPHLYDLTTDGASYEKLRNIEGPVVLLSWIYGRAAHWVLDRNGVCGQAGELELKSADEDEDEDEDSDQDNEANDDEAKPVRLSDVQARPNRFIYCLDLRIAGEAKPFLDEIQRILALQPSNDVSAEAMQRFLQPTNSTALAIDSSGRLAIADDPSIQPMMHSSILAIDETPGRRWYPVIDYSRCTNCMECIDFCLFGVYGVDGAESILVEQPDQCRKGCPACSRVCPANAIIFPQHKTPAIAGAAVDASSMKIDLSKLFGAPDRDEDPVAAAARERDEQLILAGRSAVGMQAAESTLGSPEQPIVAKTPDAFDALIDQLDALDL